MNSLTLQHSKGAIGVGTLINGTTQYEGRVILLWRSSGDYLC